MTDQIYAQQERQSLLIILNRPPQNALNSVLIDELIRLLETARSAKEISSIVLSGEGDFAFCSGIEVEKDERRSLPILENYRRLIETLIDYPKVSIAALNGQASGAGLELSLACDIRIMADHAFLHLPDLDYASIPAAGGLSLLARLAGPLLSREIFLMRKKIESATALQKSLVNEVCTVDKLISQSLKLGAEFENISPVALQWGKKCITNPQIPNFDYAAFAAVRQSGHSLEAIAAMREKRKPDFSR